MNDRLYRSRDERVIGGVAGGIADYLGIDPTLVRVLWVALAVLSGGAFIVIYVAMLFIVPEEPVLEPGAPGTGTATSAATGAATEAGQDWRALRAAERTRRREARAIARREGAAMRDDRGPIVFGLILIVLGGWFLLREYLPEVDFDRIWPLLLIGVGIAILVGSLGRGRGPGGPERPAGSGEPGAPAA